MHQGCGDTLYANQKWATRSSGLIMVLLGSSTALIEQLLKFCITARATLPQVVPVTFVGLVSDVEGCSERVWAWSSARCKGYVGHMFSILACPCPFAASCCLLLAPQQFTPTPVDSLVPLHYAAGANIQMQTFAMARVRPAMMVAASARHCTRETVVKNTS